MAKAKNKVIAGDYKGYTVISAMNRVSIGYMLKIIQINHETVKSWKIEDKEKKGPGVASVMVFGVLAFAGDKNVSTVSIEWQDGKKSLLEVDSKALKAIQSALFK